MDSGEQSMAAQGQGPRFRILVVDDEALIGHVTADMLEDLGHVAQWVPSGAEALDLLKLDQGFDLLITDHSMPGMSGGALAEAVHALRPSMPIILATGFSEPPGAQAATLPRLAKPYGPEELAAVLATIARR